MSDEMDRFVDFLRRAATDYNAPPPTPRDAMWGHIETSVFGGAPADLADGELDRFAEFLRRAAAEYNAPPPTPRDAMWDEIGTVLAPETAEDDALLAAAAVYHAPPAVPREEMWGRIEAAWQMRRSAGEAREAGLEPLSARPVPSLADPVPEPADPASSAPRRDRRRALMVTGLAIAASLVIGIAIGRRSAEQLGSDPATTVAQGIPGAGSERGPVTDGSTEPIETRTPGEPVRAQDRPMTGGEAGDAARAPQPAGRSETLETAPSTGARLAAVEPSRIDTPQGERGDVAADAPSRRAVALHYATTEHLGRAEALLTTFRNDPDAGNGAISRWAGELLAETRLLMDLPADRDPQTTALLRELELVLSLIAALGADAPSGERAFVADGLNQQGTLPRLRAAMPGGPNDGRRVGT